MLFWAALFSWKAPAGLIDIAVTVNPPAQKRWAGSTVRIPGASVTVRSLTMHGFSFLRLKQISLNFCLNTKEIAQGYCFSRSILLYANDNYSLKICSSNFSEKSYHFCCTPASNNKNHCCATTTTLYHYYYANFSVPLIQYKCLAPDIDHWSHRSSNMRAWYSYYYGCCCCWWWWRGANES